MNRQERKELTQWNRFIKEMRAKGALIEETVIIIKISKKHEPARLNNV